MKQITKFKSNGGEEFDTEKKCLEYEDFEKETKRLKKLMPKKPKNDGCSFSNGGGYLQWDKELFDFIKETVLRYGYTITKEDIFLESIKIPHCRGIVGRYIDDGSHGNPKMSLVQRVWWRLMNIDEQYREWGQCYFAINPDKGQDIRLNGD